MPIAHTACTCASGGITVLAIPAHCSLDGVIGARRTVSELVDSALRSTSTSRACPMRTPSSGIAGLAPVSRTRGCIEPRSGCGDRIGEPHGPLRPACGSRDEPPQLGEGHVDAAGDVALAGASALERENVGRGDVLDRRRRSCPPPSVAGMRPRSRSTMILPVGVGRRSPGPTGAVGSTVTTGIGALQRRALRRELGGVVRPCRWSAVAQSALASPGARPSPARSAAELDVTTQRSTPAIRAASRMPAVPPMFTAAIVA